MKRFIFSAIAMALLMICPSHAREAVIKVKNTSDIDRDSLPCSLIFQVSAKAGEKIQFRVGVGVREDYPLKTFGRYVPERLDDYAWESNKIADRIYGKALETSGKLSLTTPGIDV